MPWVQLRKQNNNNKKKLMKHKFKPTNTSPFKDTGKGLSDVFARSCVVFLFCFVLFCLFVFLGLHSLHVEVPRLGAESEL